MSARALPYLGAVPCVLAPALMLTGVHGPVRVAAALALLGLAPGVAALPWQRDGSPPLELVLVVATSLAVSALAAQAMLWFDVWSPLTATCVLGGACLLAITARLGLQRRATL